jgi:hypothetical protein
MGKAYKHYVALAIWRLFLLQVLVYSPPQPTAPDIIALPWPSSFPSKMSAPQHSLPVPLTSALAL